MACAHRLFKQRGYEGATVELIADEADVSVTTFFRYFASKEDVFLVAFHTSLTRVEQAITGRPEGMPVITALRQVLEEMMADEPEALRESLEDARSVPALHGRVLTYEENIRQVLIDGFAADLGVAPSDLQPQMLATVVVGAFEAARASWIAAPTAVTFKSQIEQALDLAEQMSESIAQGRNPT